MEKPARVLFIDSPGACGGQNRARFPQMGWALRPGLMSDKAQRLYREFQTSEMSSAWPGKNLRKFILYIFYNSHFPLFYRKNSVIF